MVTIFVKHVDIYHFYVHIEDRQIKIFVFPIDITDILRDSSRSDIEELLQNINNMSLKCKTIPWKISIFQE